MSLHHCCLHPKQSLMMAVHTLQRINGNKPRDFSPKFLGNTKKPCTITPALELLAYLLLLGCPPCRRFSLETHSPKQYKEQLSLESSSREVPWHFLPTPFFILSSQTPLRKKIIICSFFNRAKTSLNLL